MQRRKTKSKRAAPSARKATARRSPVKPTGDGRYDAVLADLHAKRDRIDAAIAVLEGLG